MKKIKVGVVEDEMIIAETICLALKRLNYDFCKPANSYGSALLMIETESPDILLLDINLNADLDGIDVAHFVNGKHSIPIVYLTANNDIATIERCKTTLPSAFLAKPFREADLLAAIELGMYNYNVKQLLASVAKAEISKAQFEKFDLTSREAEIIELISKGLKQKNIAHKLNISEATVKKHLSNVYEKTNVKSSIEALNALRDGDS
jgi:DNA-binding NarL/FixJ family response regulator